MSDRARYWAELLREWERSGLSQAEFCRRRGIKAVNFSWWKSHLRKVVGATGRPVHGRGLGSRAGRKAKFVEVVWPAGALSPVLGASGGSVGYEVVLTSGRVLRLPAAFDCDQVVRLITAVESAGANTAGVGASC